MTGDEARPMAASSWREAEEGELPVPSEAEKVAERRAQRELVLIRTHMSAVWRFLRRLGFSPEDAEDATQEVFVIAVNKLEQVEPSSERSFLFGVALRVASRHRRSRNRRAAKTVGGFDVNHCPSSELPADELLDRKSGLRFLDQTLSEMPHDLRTTFALYELDELTVPEIAAATHIPIGTVASRLRRAREQFQAAVKRMLTKRSNES
jgi:RNA polymerase sigma-70 factor, ECF subfamily